jgi:hypothetical protein
LILVGFAASAGLAQAQVTEIYKCIGPNGRPLYTSDRKDTSGKQCQLVSREVNVVPAQKPPPRPPAAAAPARGDFPKESPEARASAKDRQRVILEHELATEQRLLNESKQALAAQEAVRSGNERNYARVLERLKPYQDNVELHQKNIEALKRELANLYK